MVEDENKNEDKKPTEQAEGTKEKDDKPIVKDTPGVLEEAHKINQEKARLIEEEKKLMDRKEKLHAEQMVGGRTEAGSMMMTKEEETEARAKKESEEIVNAFR